MHSTYSTSRGRLVCYLSEELQHMAVACYGVVSSQPRAGHGGVQVDWHKTAVLLSMCVHLTPRASLTADLYPCMTKTHVKEPWAGWQTMHMFYSSLQPVPDPAYQAEVGLAFLLAAGTVRCPVANAPHFIFRLCSCAHYQGN